MVLELMEEKLRAQFLSCKTVDEIVRLAKRCGIELSDSDVVTIAMAVH